MPERMTADGHMESAPWIWTPRDQADWKTDGLLEAAHTLRADADVED